jgi:hypothetical protein
MEAADASGTGGVLAPVTCTCKQPSVFAAGFERSFTEEGSEGGDEPEEKSKRKRKEKDLFGEEGADGFPDGVGDDFVAAGGGVDAVG